MMCYGYMYLYIYPLIFFLCNLEVHNNDLGFSHVYEIFNEGDNLLSKQAFVEEEGVLFCDELHNNLVILHCIVQLYK